MTTHILNRPASQFRFLYAYCGVSTMDADAYEDGEMKLRDGYLDAEPDDCADCVSKCAAGADGSHRSYSRYSIVGGEHASIHCISLDGMPTSICGLSLDNAIPIEESDYIAAVIRYDAICRACHSWYNVRARR